MNTNPTRLYTPQFLLLCLSNVLFAASFGMILPELPAYLASLGGAEYKGLIIGLFTLTAGISRPISGKLADTVGRVPVMIIGSLVCVVCSLLYPFVGSVFGFLLLRLFHGFSTGFKPTASTALVADLVPQNRRGEALGIAGISGSIGLSGGPILGSSLAYYYSIDVMFYASSIIAAVSIIIILGIGETVKNPQRFRFSLLKLSRRDIICISAVPAGIVTFCMYFPYGAILTIVPDQCDFLGIENKGTAFAAFTGSSMLSRLIAGKVSDIFGRIPVLYASAAGAAIALFFLGQVTTGAQLYWAIGFSGFALGIGGPAVFAWAIDLSAETERGRAMGTVYICLEAAIGIGALLSAWIYANEVSQFAAAFGVTAGVTFLTMPYLVFRK